MAFTPIPNTCKVELLSHDSASNADIVNVMHALCGSAPTPTDLTNIGDCFVTFMSSFVSNLCPGTTTAISVTVTDLNSATGPQVVLPVSGVTGGGTAGATGVCALLKLTTTERGRSYRGRVYLGPLTAAAVDGDRISSGTLSDIGTYVGTLGTALQALSPASTIVVASRVLGLATEVVNYLTEILPAYQRRRGAR